MKRSFGQYHESGIKLTDSTVTLHWINNKALPLKQWVRNRVVDICRFDSPEFWRCIKSTEMIADFGTRRGVTIQDVCSESAWMEVRYLNVSSENSRSG